MISFDKSTTIITSNIGYFYLILATGIKTGFIITYFRKDSNETGYNFGPYLRYFLKKKIKEQTCFLRKLHYYGAYNTSNSVDNYSYGFTAGPVIFLNSSALKLK
jgi:hypothetical protein